VNSLIRDALIEGKTADDNYEKDGYAVRWTFFNELELIFVVRPTASGLSRDLNSFCSSLRSLIVGRISARLAVDLRRRPPCGPQICFRQVV
jgi:hypothetical protein